MRQGQCGTGARLWGTSSILLCRLVSAVEKGRDGAATVICASPGLGKDVYRCRFSSFLDEMDFAYTVIYAVKHPVTKTRFFCMRREGELDRCRARLPKAQQ